MQMKKLDNHELRMAYAKLLANINDATYEKNGEVENEACFEFKGFSIHNPFMDVTGRFSVNPIEEYRDSFINSKFYNPIIQISLYDGKLTLSEYFTVYDNDFQSSISFNSSLEELQSAYKESREYFTDEMLISMYFKISEGKLVDANELVGDLESAITGRGSIYDVECLTTLIGDGYKWIEFEMEQKIHVVAENIRHLVIGD